MSSEYLIFMGIMAFVGMLIVCRIAIFFRSYMKEWRYITDEIDRSGPGERPRWKRARKRLLLSLIPFYRPRRRK